MDENSTLGKISETPAQNPARLARAGETPPEIEPNQLDMYGSDGKINLISRGLCLYLYTHYKDSLCGMTIPNIRSLDGGTYAAVDFQREISYTKLYLPGS